MKGEGDEIGGVRNNFILGKLNAFAGQGGGKVRDLNRNTAGKEGQ